MRLSLVPAAIVALLAGTAVGPASGANPTTAPAVVSGGTRRAVPGDGNVAFSSLGYGDTSVRGVSSSAMFFFPLTPGAVADSGSTIDLELSHSPLLVPDLSTVSVGVGGVSLVSAYLTPENADRGHVVVNVPPQLVTGKGLSVDVRFYLRLTRDPCEDPTNAALWATVYRGSSLRLTTTVTSRDLHDLPDLLAPPPTGGTPLQLDVPPNGSPEVLAAAGTTAWQLGRLSASAERDPNLRVVSALAPDAAAVLVGTGAEVASDAMLPVEWTGNGYGTGSTAIGRDDGVLAVSQGGALRLLVGGATPPAVGRAADALADPARAALLAGPVATVSGVGAAPLPRASMPWTSSAASFAQLGIDTRDVMGPGTHVIDIGVERPPGWTTEATGHLDLVLDTTPDLGDRSHVQASVNGSDLGTQRLVAGPGPRTYRFDVSGGLVDRRLDGQPVRDLTLRLTLALEPVRQACTPVDVTAVRASVLPTSAWLLPHGLYGGFDLGRFPYRIADSRGHRAVVVLPRGADDTAVAAGVQLCAALGRWSEPGTPSPILTTADRLSDDERRVDNLVLLGSADQDLGITIDTGRTAVTAAPGATVAMMALRPSPFNGRRAVMVVHGDSSALLLAAEGLSSKRIVTSLRGGRAALVGTPPSAPSAPPQSLEASPGAGPPPQLAPVVTTSGVRSQAIVGAIVLGLFLSIVLVVGWYRWLRPRRRG